MVVSFIIGFFSAVAPVLPVSTYLCTVSEPVRKGVLYLPPDGICDYFFYDSLYKDGKNTVLGGVGSWEQSLKVFIAQVANFSKTEFGFSFQPEPTFLQESKRSAFFVRMAEFWNADINHFGLLNLYRQYAEPAVMTEALTALKELYNYLRPNITRTSPSFYVVGMTMENPARGQSLRLMKTVFTPSMFVAIGQLSYPIRTFKDCYVIPGVLDCDHIPRRIVLGRDTSYGIAFNETLAALGEVQKLGLSIPLAVSFSLKGVYYAPKSTEKPYDYKHWLPFTPCEDHPPPYYADPKEHCGDKDWNGLPLSASNLHAYRVITFVTEDIITAESCKGKLKNLKLKFGLAAYDVDFDSNAPCGNLFFDILSGTYGRTKRVKEVSDFVLNSFTKPSDNGNCAKLAGYNPYFSGKKK